MNKNWFAMFYQIPYVTNSTLNTMYHMNAKVESIILRALIKS